MSLLLDALQRASEEKEKLAGAKVSADKQEPKVTQPEHSPLPTIVDDADIALPSTSPAPTYGEPAHDGLVAGGDQSNHDSLPDLEFPSPSSSFQRPETTATPSHQESVADAKLERTAPALTEELALVSSPSRDATSPALSEQSSAVLHADQKCVAQGNDLIAETAPVGDAADGSARLEPTVKEVVSGSPGHNHPGAVVSAQVAKEILGSTAKPSKTSQRRLIAFMAIALVVALSIGAFFVVGLPAGLFNKAPGPSPVFDPYAQKDATAPLASNQASNAEAEKTNAAETGSIPVPAKTVAGANASPPLSARPKNVDLPAGDAMANSASDIARSPAQNNVSAKPSRQKRGDDSTKPVFLAAPVSASPLDAAYAALKEGRYEDAASNYKLALARNSGEVDALLGLAYIAQRQGRSDEARTYYNEILRQFPGHPAASGGLLSIASEGDIQLATSRAAEVAQRNPDSAIALSTLGNLLAKQGRIAEAQQAYFRAFTLDPTSSLHAYNLAVALDRLHKYPQALQYYKRAVALSENVAANEPVAFSRDAALQRMLQLDATSNAVGQSSAGIAK